MPPKFPTKEKIDVFSTFSNTVYWNVSAKTLTITCGRKKSLLSQKGMFQNRDSQTMSLVYSRLLFLSLQMSTRSPSMVIWSWIERKHGFKKSRKSSKNLTDNKLVPDGMTRQLGVGHRGQRLYALSARLDAGGVASFQLRAFIPEEYRNFSGL